MLRCSPLCRNFLVDEPQQVLAIFPTVTVVGALQVQGQFGQRCFWTHVSRLQAHPNLRVGADSFVDAVALFFGRANLRPRVRLTGVERMYGVKADWT